ncbi:restriction endonuclease subunit S [Variovorax paradoxus]|uniref:restriction endonuclease subunit S n=1 Tax=Variovorax paradoxus TaxID=34073 RepID=UPI0009BBF26F|nr:restriction endonuclease subunit S [Variovorax paradoxus]
MSRLPRGWSAASLGELASFEMGQAPPGSSSNFEGVGTPFVKAGEFRERSPVIREWTTSPLKFGRSTDVFICVVGATAGKLNLGADCAIGRSVAAIRPATTGMQLFLYYQLLPRVLELRAASRGSAQGVISQKVLSSINLVVAPLGEQTRIVAKLEELLSDLDAGVAELKAAQKKLQQYRQSLLRAAVEGALTAPWRDVQRRLGTSTETGAQLLQRILTERRARWEAKQIARFNEQGKVPPKDWQKKYPAPVPPDTADLPKLPDGWVWASVEQISEIQGGIQKQPSRAPMKNKYPFLRVANVARGKLKLQDVHEIELFQGELERLALVAGDVLIVEGNGSLTEIGRCALWDGSIENAVHQNHLIRVRPVGVVSQFVETWLNSLGGIEKLSKLAATTSGLYTLSVSKISKIPVPIAPRAEQEASMRVLIDNLSALDVQEQSVEQSLKQSTAQRENILRAAFAGELVPQDPNDEPASVLLERIRAERAERAKQPKVRRIKQEKEIAAVVKKLINVLEEAGDWVPAQEAFRRCGVADGALTERIEALYAELRELDKADRLAVEVVTDAQGRKLHDKLKLLAG